ncbi:GntR family transcriptional regulator [Nocardia sp. NPDC050697]|uniref:GntR family transcriptional regulator n=1 Tax=Nocardia sp. NPDC050697 TaxID=3155158 RepID=UPI0033ED37A7
MTQDERSRTKYQVVADDLRAKIADGTYAVDKRLPTKEELAALYSRSLGTIDRALDVLRSEGVIETIHGVGTFVRSPKSEADLANEGLAARVARLEAQMMDVYANLGLNPSTDQPSSNRRVG